MERARALVLHDDRDTRALAGRLLADAGYAATTATAPREALRGAAEDPALVIAAVTALGARPGETVAQLRARWPECVLIVAYPPSLRDRAAAALAQGGDGLLPEPFYASELTAIARRVRERSGRAVAAETEGDRRGPTPVEQLAAGVAHTIRNPLQIMELMLGSAESGDDIDVDMLREMTVRMARVAKDLTRFGTTQRMASGPVDLHELVRAVFRSDNGPGATRFELDLAAEPSTVRGEREQLLTALGLLRDRAARMSPAGGTVSVVTSSWVDALELRVSDNGPAPEADLLPHFFEPDPDPDAVQNGTWLETAALAGIIRNHGGTCSVAAPDENGVTMAVRLPTG